MSDKTKTIAELKEDITHFRDERGWDEFHSPRNLATSIVLEAAELLEIFQWDRKTLIEDDIKKDREKMDNIRNEVADFVIYTISLSEKLGIDVSEAIENKLIYNAKKYPVKYFNKQKQDPIYYKKIKRLYRWGKTEIK